MVEISNSDLDFEVSGYVSLPELTRANRNYITILINGRYIKNFLLNRAIFVVMVLNLWWDASQLQLLIFRLILIWQMFNVHPTKQEVRISKEKELMPLSNLPLLKALESRI